MASIVDRAYIEINGEIIDASSIDDNVSGNKEPHKVMNKRNRSPGHKHGMPEFTISAEFPMDADVQTDFVKLLTDNAGFTSVIEYDGGQTVSYLDCEIYEVSKASKEGDSPQITVEITALDRVAS